MRQLTYDQWKDLGYQVKRGEHSTSRDTGGWLHSPVTRLRRAPALTCV